MVVGCKSLWCRLRSSMAAFHWSFPNWPVHITVHCSIWAAMASRINVSGSRQ